MPRIIVDPNYCKGCGLCIEVCPARIIELDTSRLTAKGYHPAHAPAIDKCIGCATCALVCPDVAITVER